MEVSLTDYKVDDLTRRIPKGEDVYVMMHGNIEEKRKAEQLRSQ